MSCLQRARRGRPMGLSQRSGGSMSRHVRPPLLLVGLAAAGVMFLALPIAGLLWRAPWSTLVGDLASAEIRTSLVLSVFVSASAAALAVVLGVPIAWVLARTTFPGRTLVRALALMPLVLPPVVGGVGLLTALGRRGVAGRWLDELLGVRLPFTTAGAIVAATFIALPFVVITVEGGLRNLDPRYETAAATLGASRWTTFRRVTVPLTAPAIGAGALLAWARALGEFGATITFAGNVAGRTRTMPLAIFLALQESPASAVAASLVLLAVSLVVLVALRERWFPRSV